MTTSHTTIPYSTYSYPATEGNNCAKHYSPTSSDHKTNKNRKRWRRKRTVFSPAEMAILEGVYEENKFLNPTLKANILSRVSVASNVVVMWFQNRRAKDRAAGIAI